jgi:hypothetical protein
MKRQTLALASAIFIAPQAFAGGSSIGHGGDAVVCRDSKGAILSAQLADYYEAKTVHDLNIDLGTAKTWQERVEVAAKRLGRLDPVFADVLRKLAVEFNSESRWVNGSDFPHIDDTGGLPAPYGCKIEQVAIQKAPQFPEDKRFLVNQDIWNKFDPSSQAGLFLHEAIYREELDYFAQESVGTRYFNSLISSQAFLQMNLGGYRAHWRDGWGQSGLRLSSWLPNPAIGLGVEPRASRRVIRPWSRSSLQRPPTEDHLDQRKMVENDIIC